MHKWMVAVGCSVGDGGEPVQEYQTRFGKVGEREKETEGKKIESLPERELEGGKKEERKIKIKLFQFQPMVAWPLLIGGEVACCLAMGWSSCSLEGELPTIWPSGEVTFRSLCTGAW